VRIIVTRPEPQAAQWVELLRARGVDSVALPLIRIVAARPRQAVAHDVWQKLPGYQLVMFVSPNAVSHFFSNFLPGVPWPAGTVAAATGPGTVAALREAGVPAESIAAPALDAAQFDSRTLWAELRDHDWRGAQVLIVRGEDGRDWLADTLRAAGATVEMLEAYRRAAPAWDEAQMALLREALALPNAHAWFFSSSQAISHLVAHLKALQLAPPWHRMHALATHPRIEQAAQDAGFAQVRTVAPTVDAVAQVVRALVIAPRA
jgi:uroporphyrinogen-III synthase